MNDGRECFFSFHSTNSLNAAAITSWSRALKNTVYFGGLEPFSFLTAKSTLYFLAALSNVRMFVALTSIEAAPWSFPMSFLTVSFPCFFEAASFLWPRYILIAFPSMSASSFAALITRATVFRFISSCIACPPPGGR